VLEFLVRARLHELSTWWVLGGLAS
jgi:hypothetical protein